MENPYILFKELDNVYQIDCSFLLFAVFGLSRAWAGDEPPTPITNKEAIALVQSNTDYVWTLVAAALVFFMQAGFAMGTLAFWAIGFGLMFGASASGWLGTSGFFLSDFAVGGDPWVLAFWMFQVVFAATATTIVSGAMAERTKFSS